MPRFGRPKRQVSKSLCLTLPGGVDFNKVPVRPNFPLGTFLWAFYLFRFYIWKDLLGAFRSWGKFLLGSRARVMHYVSKNLGKYNKNYYVGTALLLKSGEARASKGSRFEPTAIDLRAWKYLAIKDVNRRGFGKLFFYSSKRALVLFDEFFFRVPFVFYLAFYNLANFLKAYKYNEYLNRTCYLTFYPLLRVVLRGASRMGFIKHRAYKKTKNVFLSTRFYYDRRVFVRQSKGKLGLAMSNLAFLYNGSLFSKLLRLNISSFKFLHDYVKLPFMNGFFYFVYEVWACVERKGRDYANPNALNSHKWRIYYILHLFWFLFDHDENFPKWTCLLIGLKMCRVGARVNATNHNIIGLRTLKRERYARLANIRLCVFATVAVTFIVRYKSAYFNMLYRLASRHPRHGIRGRFLRKILRFIKRKFPTEYYRVKVEYYNDNSLLVKKLSSRAYNYDLIHWKVVYGGNFLFHAEGFDFIRASKKLKGDNIINAEYEDFLFNLKCVYQGIEILTGKRVKGKGKKAIRREVYTPKYTNEYFFIQFCSDLFLKIILASFAMSLTRHSHVKRRQSSYADWQLRLLLEKDGVRKGYKTYWEYYHKYREWYRVRMGRGTCFSMCVNIVTYSRF